MFLNMDVFTYLIPSSPENAEIYRKFGFEFVMDKREMIEKEHRRKPSHLLLEEKPKSQI